jgi:hypothetical protein
VSAHVSYLLFMPYVVKMTPERRAVKPSDKPSDKPRHLATRRIKESAVERELKARVAALGGECMKVTTPGMRGFFDRLIVLPGGLVIFCEIKRPKGGRLSPHQRRYAARLAALGVAIALIRNATDIDALLGPRDVVNRAAPI